MPDTAAAKKPELTPQENGLLSALNFWMLAAETLYSRNRRNHHVMESESKAQQELEKIETQIAQLQAAAAGNQEAQKQLAALHNRVEALRRQISGQLTPWAAEPMIIRTAGRPGSPICSVQIRSGPEGTKRSLIRAC